MGISTAGIGRTYWDSTGRMLWVTDNAYDIGANGTNRPRSLYVGADVTAGGDITIGSGAEFKWSERGRFKASTDGVFDLRSAANTLSGSLTHSLPFANKTAAYSVLATESLKMFSNLHAPVGVVFTLPVGNAGLTYTFYVEDTSGLTLFGNGAQQIRVAGSLSTATIGNVSANTVGNSLTITWTGNYWAATSVVGMWTIN